MKKLLLTLLMGLLLPLGSNLCAQNIQLHYDFGHSLYEKDLKERPLLTSTVEKFHPDKYGSTYFFVDMDYTSKGVVSAYLKIFRELKFWKPPFSVHVQYNGGLSVGIPFNNAYLGGLTYTFNNASFSHGFSLGAMYKYIQKHKLPNSFQLTGTWYINFCDNLLSFTGFADFWREKTNYGKTIFLSEPQFWVNLNKVKGISKDFNLSVGSEVELNNNFGGRDGFYAIPTLALKWTLN